jgi:hypothetical protein
MQPRRKRFSVQASDQAVLEAAGWLLLVAGFAAGWAQVAFDGYLPGDAYLASLLLPTALGALAIAVIVCVGARLALRRRWLERVRSGSVPGWSVSPVDEWLADEVTHLQPLLPGPFQGEVLARTVSDGEGYRVARRRKAVALVPVSYQTLLDEMSRRS